MTATVLPFQRPAQLPRGQRPPRAPWPKVGRTDADRLRDLDRKAGEFMAEFKAMVAEPPSDLIAHAKEGEPPRGITIAEAFKGPKETA